jgi:hypothetical protein
MKTLAAVIVSVVLGFVFWITQTADTAPEVRMISPWHDGHLWIVSIGHTSRWQPIHHPDCPCRTAVRPDFRE